MRRNASPNLQSSSELYLVHPIAIRPWNHGRICVKTQPFAVHRKFPAFGHADCGLHAFPISCAHDHHPTNPDSDSRQGARKAREYPSRLLRVFWLSLLSLLIILVTCLKLANASNHARSMAYPSFTFSHLVRCNLSHTLTLILLSRPSPHGSTALPDA
jgi:hypothetical protein